MKISDNFDYLTWTEEGIIDDNSNFRDLALTILENTRLQLSEKGIKVLETSRDNKDEDPHLRRKAALALFKHGDRSVGTIDRLLDAYQNDQELRNRASVLLGLSE